MACRCAAHQRTHCPWGHPHTHKDFLTNIVGYVTLNIIMYMKGVGFFMKIRFCEFCSNVVKGETYCDICGCQLSQDVEEETFNNSKNPWPFTPVKDLTLMIQGEPRKIHFEGTHSLYHLLKEMNRGYSNLNMWYRLRGKDEMELATFHVGHALRNFRPLGPDEILNCTYRRFSFYVYAEPDPELGLPGDMMETTYQGTVDLVDCPDRDIPYMLGWILATAPKPRHADGWVYKI